MEIRLIDGQFRDKEDATHHLKAIQFEVQAKGSFTPPPAKEQDKGEAKKQ